MVTEEMLKFSMVFEDAAGSKTDYWPLGRGRLIRCCHRRDYRRHELESSGTNHAIWKMHDSQLLSWERLQRTWAVLFKKYKAENINAIELCQTASVVIYNYFQLSLLWSGNKLVSKYISRHHWIWRLCLSN